MHYGTVVAHSIMVEPRPIILVPGILERVGTGWSRDGGLAERGIGVRGFCGTRWVTQQQGRPQCVAVVELRGGPNASKRLVEVQATYIRGGDRAVTDFLQDILAIVQKLRGDSVDRLADATVEGIIDEAGCDRGTVDRRQTVPSIPDIGGGTVPSVRLVRFPFASYVALGVDWLMLSCSLAAS